MARSAKTKDDDDVTELKPMDFKQAVKIYRTDIAPERTEASSHMQSVGEGFKAIKKTCHIQPGAAKAAIKAFEQEDAFRDDYLRGFVGMLNEMLGFELVTFNGEDLVDQAEGKATRAKPKLVAVPEPSDGTETDLVDAAEDLGGAADDFDEAGEDELAAQTPRKASVAKIASPEPASVN